MNLLGVVDANCCFTLVDVGAHGRENDSSVFSNSSFREIDIDTFVNCNWVNTRWQCYSTHNQYIEQHNNNRTTQITAQHNKNRRR